MPEEELPVEIAQVDCIKINDVNLTKASEDKILQELTAYSPSANQEYTRLIRNPSEGDSATGQFVALSPA